MSEDLFAKLVAEIEGEAPAQVVEAPILPDEPLFPSKDTITLMTANLFENTHLPRELWMQARHALNIQVFDRREPFTPDARLAVFTGTVQLHTPEFFSSYLEQYRGRHKEAVSNEAWQYYKNLTHRTLDIQPDAGCPAPKLGQLYSKTNGTHYVWNHIVRLQWTTYATFAELFCDDDEPIVIDLTEPAQKKHENEPILRGRYDPHTLWRRKTQKKKAKTP